MSPDILKEDYPLIDNDESLFVVIDNFRLDQWWLIKELLDDYYTIEDDELYYSILPTATQYARNAIFSGLMPLQIEELFPDLWIGEEDEENKNINEEELIQTQITRYRKKIDFSYHKINNTQAGEKLVEQLKQLENKQLNVCVLIRGYVIACANRVKNDT